MRLLLYLLFFTLSITLFGQNILIPTNSVWKYADQGPVPMDWNTLAFDDNPWSQGNAELGYGEGDEGTVVSYGPSSSNKHMTTYFRKTITIADPSIFASLTGELKRDDGAVVYINGNEVWRSNMPGGLIGFNTPSDGTVAWPFEDDWYFADFSAIYLQPGNNVIAVEIHQDEPSSSDISFNFALNGNLSLNASLVRGPYLQKATQNSMVLRWRTDVPTDSKVHYGISPSNLNSVIALPTFETEHTVEVTGLNPGTTYYYSIGSNNTIYASGLNHYFETLPLAFEDEVYSFLVLGDAGTGEQGQIDTKNAVLDFAGTSHFNGVLLLGDNAYQSGFDSEYQDNFFANKYNEIFENTVIWPAPGNHDYNNHIPFSPSPAYFDIFNCPTNGESGGVPSGTEKYYSFNHGNIHFVSLDSYDVSRSASGEMATWLQQDLSVNQLEWVVVFFHHPPYTKGSHDSDNTFFLDGELVDMRENILPIMEQYGVDLVLNGHSHSYERSMLIDGHYGSSDSFGPQYTKDSGSGSYPVDCPYEKHTENGVGHQGTVYAVVGCSGKISDVQSDWPHPVMYSYTAEKMGSILLTIEKNRMDAMFLTSLGEEFDRFTIVKNAGSEQTVTVCPDDQVNFVSSWPENVIWTPSGQQSETFSISALSDGTVTATDALACIQDVFHIDVVDEDTCGSTNAINDFQDISPSVQVIDGKLVIELDSPTEYAIYTANGQMVHEFKAEQPVHVENISFLKQGFYLIRTEQSNQTIKIYLHE